MPARAPRSLEEKIGTLGPEQLRLLAELDLGNERGLRPGQVAALAPVVAALAALRAISRSDLNARLEVIARAAESLTSAQEGGGAAETVAALAVQPWAIPAPTLSALAIAARMARRPGRQRSDPMWIGWIDDALRYNWPASERYPRRLGPSSKAFAEVVAICAEAAGLAFPKRALARYPKWRRLQQQMIQRRARAAALRRSTPTSPEN